MTILPWRVYDYNKQGRQYKYTGDNRRHDADVLQRVNHPGAWTILVNTEHLVVRRDPDDNIQIYIHGDLVGMPTYFWQPGIGWTL